MKTIIYALLIVILVGTSILTGCTQDNSTTTLPGTTSSSNTINPGNTTTTAASPNVNVSLGNGVLNLYDYQDPTILDPAMSAEIGSSQYILEIFSGLLRLDDNLQPVPDIAAQMPSVSSDGVTYTFKLRKDVKFQDGRAVTADDVKCSWERAANPATQSQNANTYLGDIVGVSDVLSGKTSEISGIKVIDQYTLQVIIDSPKSYFLYKLSYPTTFVVDKNDISSGDNWWKDPNGTGPFKLDKWNQGASLTLIRSDYYYGTKPQLKQINFQYYTGLPMDLFETGKIDVAAVSTSYIDAVSDKSGPFYNNLSVVPSLGISYIGFNCAKPPFDDVNVRQAFAMAIDKDKIISLIFKGMEDKASGILPPGLPGYNPSISGLSFNPDKAKELIKTSKYGDISQLPSITLTTYGYGGGVGSLYQALVYQWKQTLGVDVKIRQIEPERYFYNAQTEIDQIFETSWSADYPHPQDFLDIMFKTGSTYNYGNYSNPEVDALITQANQSTNESQSFALYQKAEQLMINDAACMPIAFAKNYILVKPYVKGYTINGLGFATLDKVSIEDH